jgi:hypothetical protein
MLVMNKVTHIIKHFHLRLMPLLAVLILGGLYPSYCAQKKRIEKNAEKYVQLSKAIDNHTKAIKAKLATDFGDRTLNMNFPSSQAERFSAQPVANSFEELFAPRQIRGIAFLADNPLVFIGNLVLKPGDKLGAFTIETIELDHFTVSDHSGQTRQIRLNPETVQE